MSDLGAPPPIEANTRFKYSNHGYGLLGLMVEAITNETYSSWIRREIVDPSGLEETEPDFPLPRGIPMARGHSGRLPLGRRVIIPGDNPTHALAPATGFVSTAQDLALFFGHLSPKAKRSVLSRASRREMTRRQWRLPHTSFEQHYGYGTASGTLGGWDWFGHGGGFQGFITRTAVLPQQELAIAVLTNSLDGLAPFWLDGVLHTLQAFARNGAPSRKASSWSGRWWSHWGAIDLVPMGDKVLVAGPGFFNPFVDATEIAVTGRNHGRISLAAGYANHGEEVRLTRSRGGKILSLRLAGGKFLPERRIVEEMQARYEAPKKRIGPKTRRPKAPIGLGR